MKWLLHQYHLWIHNIEGKKNNDQIFESAWNDDTYEILGDDFTKSYVRLKKR